MGKVFVPPIMPGFDNSHASWGDPSNPKIPRSIDFYKKMIDLALNYLDEDIPLTQIATLDDYGEDTFIAPTIQESLAYLTATRDSIP